MLKSDPTKKTSSNNEPSLEKDAPEGKPMLLVDGGEAAASKKLDTSEAEESEEENEEESEEEENEKDKELDSEVSSDSENEIAKKVQVQSQRLSTKRSAEEAGVVEENVAKRTKVKAEPEAKIRAAKSTDKEKNEKIDNIKAKWRQRKTQEAQQADRHKSTETKSTDGAIKTRNVFFSLYRVKQGESKSIQSLLADVTTQAEKKSIRRLSK